MTGRDERGAGLVSTSLGVLVLLVFLLFAVQVSLGLLARSTAGATAFDQARRLAARGPACDGGIADAEATTAARLRGWWPEVRVTARCTGDEARVEVDADRSRSLVPPALLGPSRIGTLHRTAVARLEVPR